MVSYTMYQKIQFLHGKGVYPAEIVRQTGLDWKTVQKYLEMDVKEFLALSKNMNPNRCFDLLRDDILQCYQRAANRRLHMSSVYDFLLEKYGSLPGTERSLRNYIHHLLHTGALTFEKASRRYQSVVELPFGRQMQVDFGQCLTSSGLKLYILATVLSASRYKIAYFHDRPFTTLEVIRGILDVFCEIGGAPRELVIDQDRLLVVSENYGDILFTKDFGTFIEEQGLTMYVCRKGDPETKGKVENLVGFIKKNFLDARDFSHLREAQVSLRKWLFRRANGQPSAATGHIPQLALEEEKKHLLPLRASIFQRDEFRERVSRRVDKLSRITIQAKKYKVPEEYRNKEIEISQTPEKILFFDASTKRLVGECSVNGSIVNMPTGRKPSCALQELRVQAIQAYTFPEWLEFLRRNQEKYPRYVRDQLGIFRRHLLGKAPAELLQKAVEFCLASDTIGMKDLHDTYLHLERRQKNSTMNDPIRFTPLGHSASRSPVTVAKRSPQIYREVLPRKEDRS